jgi:hypothetical protein
MLVDVHDATASSSMTSNIVAAGRYAVLGFGESWREAPITDSGVTIIGLNELYKYLTRWDEWVEIHDEESIGLTTRVGQGQVQAEVEAHRRWLSRDHVGKTIWMQERFCDGRFPSARPYPIDALKQQYARLIRRDAWDYFTSTVAYILAMTIARGRDADFRPVSSDAASWIGLYGIELIGAGEYQYQRPCVEMFVGLALGLGIEIHVPESSALLKSDHMYGFQRAPADDSPVGEVRLRARLDRLRKQHDGLVTDINKIKGAIVETQNWLTVVEAAKRGVDTLPENFLEE